MLWQEVEDIQQELSLFKGHPMSCQYGDALCSMVPMLWHSAETPNPGTMPWSTHTLLVGAYFELSFLGCGFLIHLSNRSNSPRFRAPWKKIRQKYGTRQEPSLFKDHALSCQYGDALCSMVPMLWHSAETPNQGTMPWST